MYYKITRLENYIDVVVVELIKHATVSIKDSLMENVSDSLTAVSY